MMRENVSRELWAVGRGPSVKRDGAPQGQPRGVPVRFHDILGPA
jgi:hypothetical protein